MTGMTGDWDARRTRMTGLTGITRITGMTGETRLTRMTGKTGMTRVTGVRGVRSKGDFDNKNDRDGCDYWVAWDDWVGLDN